MKQKVEVATLPVQLPSQPTQSTCVSLVQALLKHLLYARGHIPYIYDQLLQQTLEEEEQALEAQQSRQPGRKRRRRLKKSDKRRLQFMQRAETLLDSIVPALFATDQPTRCYILLGASTANPREAYEIVLPAATPAAQGEPDPAAAARDDYACRVLLRQLITSTPDLPEGTAALRPGKVYLLVQAPAGEATLAGFLIKRVFKLTMRKGTHTTFWLGGAALQQQAQHQVNAVQQGGGLLDVDPVVVQQALDSPALARSACESPVQPASMWLQSRWVLRGLKIANDMSGMC